MSKLELFIKRCREIWEIMSVEPGIMDEMIDTLIRPALDFDKLTDDDIKESTQNYINNAVRERLEKERKLKNEQ